MRVCTRCQKTKNPECFGVKNAAKSGLLSACKECIKFYNTAHYKRNKLKINARSKAWHEANPHVSSIWKRRYKLKKNYGLSLENFDAMKNKQNGLCAISGCGRLCNTVDHCHKTGRVRGLLCGSCNRALGLLGESIERIEGLKKYLQ
jgi:hypothetical protein